MAQLLSRFSRSGGKAPATVYLLRDIVRGNPRRRTTFPILGEIDGINKQTFGVQ